MFQIVWKSYQLCRVLSKKNKLNVRQDFACATIESEAIVPNLTCIIPFIKILRMGIFNNVK